MLKRGGQSIPIRLEVKLIKVERPKCKKVRRNKKNLGKKYIKCNKIIKQNVKKNRTYNILWNRPGFMCVPIYHYSFWFYFFQISSIKRSGWNITRHQNMENTISIVLLESVISFFNCQLLRSFGIHRRWKISLPAGKTSWVLTKNRNAIKSFCILFSVLMINRK